MLSAILALAACGAPASPPPVILISIDTLRADRVGVYGNKQGLTPNIDAFAESAVVFGHTWAQSNQTNLSHASLFTSRYPSELGAIANGFSPATSIPTLASVLSVYGYQTAAFTGGGHLTRGFGLERGFSTWETPQELGSFFHTVPPALAWLDARDTSSPFLLFLHSYDTHERYLKPSPIGTAWAEPGYRGPAEAVVTSSDGTSRLIDHRAWPSNPAGLPLDLERLRVHDAAGRADQETRANRQQAARLTERDENFVRAAYDGAVAYADGWFGALVAELDARDLLDSAVVIVISDHGESLGENGLWGHSYSLTDADLAVPLIVRLPGGAHGGARVDADVALLDVLPTTLELTGATAPSGIHGRSLVPFLTGGAGATRDAVFSEGAFRITSARSATQRLTFSGVDANSPFFSDLLRTADLAGPAFADSTAAPTERTLLRDAAIAWRAELKPAPVFQHSDPELIKAMQDHGYWEAQ